MRPLTSILSLLAAAAIVTSAQAWPHSPVGGGYALPGGVNYASAPVPDTKGGFFVAYAKYSVGYDLYAQHYDGAGNALWGNGVVICNLAGDQYSPQAVVDGFGGMLVAWTDTRSSASTGFRRGSGAKALEPAR